MAFPWHMACPPTQLVLPIQLVPIDTLLTSRVPLDAIFKTMRWPSAWHKSNKIAVLKFQNI